MGAVEDSYRRQAAAELQARLEAHNAQVDRCIALLPTAIAYVNADSPDGGQWLNWMGEQLIGWQAAAANWEDSAPKIYFLTSGVILYVPINGTLTALTLRHATTEDEIRVCDMYVVEGLLRKHQPKPPPPPKRRWWQPTR